MNLQITERFWNVVTIIAVILFAGVALFDTFAPKPVVTKTKRQFGQDRAVALKQAEEEKEKLQVAQNDVSKYVWSANSNVQSQSLSTVTALATKYKVQLQSFRPERSTEEDGLVHMPYLILVQGDYLSVTKMLKDVENPRNKLAVNMVQYSSADTSTDRVNATIGVIAYALPAPAVIKTTKSNATKKI
jgi:hypothetical protein